MRFTFNLVISKNYLLYCTLSKHGWYVIFTQKVSDVPMSHEDMTSIMNEVDFNKNGQVDLAEFLQVKLQHVEAFGGMNVFADEFTLYMIYLHKGSWTFSSS